VQRFNRPKLFLVVNVEWSFLSHRLPLGVEAIERGFDVTVFAVEEEGRGDEIRAHGIRFIPLPTTRGGRNPLVELRVLAFLYKIYKDEQPNIVHHVAIKPVLIGSLAARLAGVPKIVNTLTGLGSIYLNEDWRTTIYRVLITKLLKYTLNSEQVTLIVQNEDDFYFALSLGCVKINQLKIIKGSGVDLERFYFTDEEVSPVLRIILPARMLLDKGIKEFKQASQFLTSKYQDKAVFIMAGKIDGENISGVSRSELLIWNSQGGGTWIGHQEDVPRLFREAHIVVLPSYREGLPKALIEAAATGRPIVTTDVPGCREVVEDGYNGLLVKPKDVSSLTEAIDKLITDSALRKQMGINGRKKVEAEFSVQMVLTETFKIYEGNA
jgi:glycosyltransferase involved in cell wall biosynthesis